MRLSVDEGRERTHPRLLRMPGGTAWRCVLSLAAFAVAYGVLQLALALFEVVLFGGFGQYVGALPDGTVRGAVPALYGVALNLLYLGIAVLAVRAVFDVRAGWTLSVTGRWRPRWFLVAGVVGALLAVLVGSLADTADTAGTGGSTGPGPRAAAGWVVVAVLVALSTAALEEVVLRGWLAQSVGALFGRPVVGLVLAAAASTTAFVWLRDPEPGAQTLLLAGTGLALFALVLATGGLEASFAVNAGLQLAFLVPLAAAYGLDTRAAGPDPDLTQLLAVLAAAAVLAALSARTGVARRGRPEGTTRNLSDLSDVRGVR